MRAEPSKRANSALYKWIPNHNHHPTLPSNQAEVLCGRQIRASDHLSPHICSQTNLSRPHFCLLHLISHDRTNTTTFVVQMESGDFDDGGNAFDRRLL